MSTVCISSSDNGYLIFIPDCIENIICEFTNELKCIDDVFIVNPMKNDIVKNIDKNNKNVNKLYNLIILNRIYNYSKHRSLTINIKTI